MVTQHSFALAVALGAALLSTGARAGQCPADEVGVDVTKPVTTPAKGVTDTVLSTIDLSKEPAGIAGRTLRLRKLVVQPGESLPGTATATAPPSSISSMARSPNTPAIARCQSCTRPAMSRARPVPRRIGGRTPAARL